MKRAQAVSIAVDIPLDIKPGTIIKQAGKSYEMRSIESIEFVTEKIMLVNGTARVTKV